MQNQQVVQVNIKSLAIVQTMQKCVLVTINHFCVLTLFSVTLKLRLVFLMLPLIVCWKIQRWQPNLMSEESKVGHGASVLRVVVFNAHKLTLIHQHHFSFLAIFFILKKSIHANQLLWAWMVLVKTYQSYLPVITVLLLQNVFHLHGFVFGQTGQTGQTWCVFDQWLLKPNLGTFYNVNDAITL